jgi:hypothetical protein
VEKSNGGQKVWVFRTPPEKWFKDCIAPMPKGNGISLMVWGYFWGTNRSTFCPLIVKSVIKHVYIKLLEYILLPVIYRI